jgi:hypothetical protein
MARGPGRLGLQKQGWLIPAVVCCCLGGAAIVVRLVWLSSRGARRRRESHSEAVSEVSNEDIHEAPQTVQELDWQDLKQAALGQKLNAPDQSLQLLVEGTVPADALDVLYALCKPGSLFWAYWQEQQNHHQVLQGEWHKQSSPLGTNIIFTDTDSLSDV